MAPLMLPRGLVKPEVVDLIGVPEIFCDIAFVRDFGSTVRILLCSERSPSGGIVDLTGKLVMPFDGYRRSLQWVLEDDRLRTAMHN